ncbi:MAG: hypothetical protein COT16_03685 [Elusimicrobia bacterium CG08_land_8_20_14_0_20_44_26]|nr:MAG: hypothetical protein COT16_03685 [Elusimicrobia bacterium CG08_land_8_20_14_0_20_44_26]
MNKVFVLLFLAVSGVCAQEDYIAIVNQTSGEVTALRKGADSWKEVAKDDAFAAGDIIKTEENSSCEIYLIDGTIFEIGPSSVLKIQELSGKDDFLERTILDLEMGDLLSEIEKGLDYSVRTPQAVCAVRGTKFAVSTGESKESKIAVFKGRVGVKNYEKSGLLSKTDQIINEMQEAHVALYNKPQLMKKLSKEMSAVRDRMVKNNSRRKKLRKKIFKERKALLEKRKEIILERNREKKEELIKERKSRRNPRMRSPEKKR